VSFSSTPRSTRARVAFGSLALSAALLVPMPAAAQEAEGPRIFVIGGKSDDPFWSKVKRGADDAGLVVAANGGSVTWLGPQTYDNLGPDAARLILNAVSQDADGIVGPNWVPEAMDEAFEQVVASGIPLVIYNAGGMDAASRLGAINYIGSEEYAAGLGGGRFFGASGRTNVLCVNTLPGATNTEDRCRGIADGISETGGTSTQLPLPSSTFGNPTAVAQAIVAALLDDETVDGVVTISSGDANSAASGIEQAGVTDRVALGTFDMDEASLQRIRDGSQLFSIDQQPYLQGYLAVSLLNSHILYGLDFPQKPTLTGPAIIHADNVESAITGAAAGVR
jgi:simple sugar transport system substrate-binding protein